MALSKYWQLAAANPRFLAFGFLAAFASSFGQTYFIGVFGPSVEAEFELSHTAWASYYLVGTLLSALALPWTGRRIDTLPLRKYSLLSLCLLIVGALLLSGAHSVWLLIVAIFCLRQAGQGLMSHIAVTSMTRYFEASRGRAIALATLGLALGEACLPILALAAISAFGWRFSFAGVGVVLAVVILPTIALLLSNHGKRHADYLRRLEMQSSNSSNGPDKDFSYREFLRDTRFYLLLPGVLAPALVVTALFFTHLNLAQAKGWSGTWVTGSYVIYALATTLTALFCGPLIDRVGGARIVPAMLLPMALSLCLLGLSDHRYIVFPYFVTLGISVGISHTAVSAMWAELYGVRHIGTIKSLVTSLAVLASAIGPVIMGAMRDTGNSIETVYFCFAIYVLLASVLLAVGIRRFTRT